MGRSKERVLAALRHEEPDRIPMDLGGSCSTIEDVAYKELLDYLGWDKEVRCFNRCHVDIDEELLLALNIDTRYVRLNPPGSWKKEIIDHSYIDEFGVKWGKPESSLYWDPVDFPLKNAESVKEIEDHPWHDPYDKGRTAGLREKAKALAEQGEYAIFADVPILGVLETASFIRGMEQVMMDLMGDQDMAMALLERVSDFTVKLYDGYLDAVGEYIDVIGISEDLGSQHSLLISPQTYREMIRPFHRKLIDKIKSKTKAKVWMHSCGAIVPLIPDLIENGVDIINPVQTNAKGMDTIELKKRFGDNIVFWGAIDTQNIMAFGSVQDVEKEVKRCMHDLGQGGGYVLTAGHDIQAGVSPEKIMKLFETGLKYGNYPLGSDLV